MYICTYIRISNFHGKNITGYNFVLFHEFFKYSFSHATIKRSSRVEFISNFLAFNKHFLVFRLMVRASQCLVDNELSVSKQSHKFLKALAMIRIGNNQICLFTEPFISSLKEMSEVQNDSLQLRVLELMVEISNISQEHLEK